MPTVRKVAKGQLASHPSLKTVSQDMQEAEDAGHHAGLPFTVRVTRKAWRQDQVILVELSYPISVEQRAKTLTLVVVEAHLAVPILIIQNTVGLLSPIHLKD